MEKTNLMSIKRESVKAIFKSITENDNVSRSTISKETGLSLMTVGKVVDALLEIGVVCQVKETKASAGRKAGLINLKNDSFMLVIDLSSKDFSVSIIDIKLGVIDRMTYSYNSEFYFEENLFIFLKNVKSYLGRKFDMSKIIGTGITVPGKYDLESDSVIGSRLTELENIKIKETIEKALETGVSFIEEDIKMAALSNINAIQGDEKGVLLYVYVGDDDVGAVTLINGQILYGNYGGAGNIKDMLVDGTKTYKEILESTDKTEALTAASANVLYNAALMVDPAKIVVECKRFNFSDECIEKLKNSLGKNAPHSLPEILISDSTVRHSHRGIAMKMREMWLEKIIK